MAHRPSSSISTAAGSNTVVMSLMNGVDSESRRRTGVGAEHLLHSFIKGCISQEADGYHFDPDATLGDLWRAICTFESERAKAVGTVHGFRSQLLLLVI